MLLNRLVNAKPRMLHFGDNVLDLVGQFLLRKVRVGRLGEWV